LKVLKGFEESTENVEELSVVTLFGLVDEVNAAIQKYDGVK